MRYRSKDRKAFFPGRGFIALMIMFFMSNTMPAPVAASEWKTIVWKNDTKLVEELQRMCRAYGIVSGDVFWANGYNTGTCPPDGEVLLVPESKNAIISTWMEVQNRKNGTPGPIVSVKLHGVPAPLRETRKSSDLSPEANALPQNAGAQSKPSSGALPDKKGSVLLTETPAPVASIAEKIVSSDGAKKRPLFSEDIPLVTVKLHGRPALLQTQVSDGSAKSVSVAASPSRISKDSIAVAHSSDTHPTNIPPFSVIADSTPSDLSSRTPIASEDCSVADRAPTRPDPIKNMKLIVSGDKLVILTPSGSKVMEDDAPPPHLASLPPLVLTPPKHPPLAPQTSTMIAPGKMMWPVSGRVSSGFGMRGKRHFHAGLDIPMPKGTPIHAAMDGIVMEICTTRDKKYRGYGNGVLLKHPNGLVTMYAHCQKVLVKRGQKVRQGEIIALVGNTGRTTTWHVHFEVRKNGKPVNPTPYLAKR